MSVWKSQLCHILGVDCLKMSASALFDPIVGARVAFGVEAVDSGGGEVAGGHFLLEENVELGVCATLGFGKTKESPDEAKKASAGVEETSLSAPIL
jgi:hypothetical protein